MGVWAGISARGPTCFKLFEQGHAIDAERYQEILKECLFGTADILYPEGYVLVQDNARAHVAWDTLLFLVGNGVDFSSWPSQSPDLNPIENLWAVMKTKVEAELPTTKPELKNAIVKVWRDIDPVYTSNFVHSMPNRIEQCIARAGGPTDY